MEVTIKSHFNKQTKDSKKELIQFYVTGEGENKPELDKMCREVVELEIDGIEVVITAEFSKKSKDGKKTTLEFIVKGDTSAAQTFEFYKKAGSDVNLTVAKAQMSIEDFHGHEPRDGVKGTINKDGTVNVDDRQMSIDEAAAAAEGITSSDPAANGKKDEKVTNISTKRGKKKDQEEPKPDPVPDGNDDLQPIEDDDLPF